MQQADIGPVSDMQAWERMKMTKPNLSEPQPSLPTYYNNADENISKYVESFRGLNPEVDDPDRKSTRLNSSHSGESRMPSSA